MKKNLVDNDDYNNNADRLPSTAYIGNSAILILSCATFAGL